VPVALERRAIDVDVFDGDAVRRWLTDRVAEAIRLKGHPPQRIVLLADGHELSLDLEKMLTDEPGADVGATFQALKDQSDIHRRALMLAGQGVRHDGTTDSIAVVFEERDEAPRYWWAMTQYRADPTTNVGQVSNTWGVGESDDLSDLPPFLQAVVTPPPAAAAARVLPPRRVDPDIQVMFAEIPDDRTPSDANQMAELAHALVASRMLSGELGGVVAVRLAGRKIQVWAMQPDTLPTDVDDMLRYICQRGGPADGIALAQFAIQPQDDPPKPGLQVVAERGGMRFEIWGLLEFPNGPRGAKTISKYFTMGPTKVGDSGLWLGIDPMVAFELGPIEGGEA
jgi:hypothetical protein